MLYLRGIHWWCEISVSCVSKYLLYANIFHWNERHETTLTREGLPILCSELLPFDGLFPVIRTDPAQWVYCFNQWSIISQSSQINIIGSYLIISVFVAEQKTQAYILCNDPICHTVTPLSLHFQYTYKKWRYLSQEDVDTCKVSSRFS